VNEVLESDGAGSDAPRAPPGAQARAWIGAPAALRIAFGVALVVLVGLVLPFTPWLVLAAWVAAAARPGLASLSRLFGGRRRGAAVMTLGLLVVLVGPLLAIVGLLAADAIELGTRLSRSGSGREALAQLVSSDDAGVLTFDPAALFTVVQDYGERALALLGTLVGLGADLAIGVFVFFSAAYVLLVDGPLAWTWTAAHAPLDEAGLERLRAAFHETGRGLFVGIGLTGVVQAAIATGAYLALGVPRPLVLGLVTFIASVIPTVGTALVWIPIAIALAITGRATAALVLALVGTIVISGIDNVIRPILTRTGHLELHTFVLLLSMLGGLAILGPAGLFLGPLAARLAVEVVRMAREAGLVGHDATAAARPLP
jgi:predicted PurR-regulated permease PerM